MDNNRRYRVPSLADWKAKASGLGLKRAGGELVGPCPACGGTDRFRVTRRGGIFCRHCCPDGRGSIEAIHRIVAAAGFARLEAEDQAPRASRGGRRADAAPVRRRRGEGSKADSGGIGTPTPPPNRAVRRSEAVENSGSGPKSANSDISDNSGGPPPHQAEPEGPRGPGPSEPSGPNSDFARRLWKATAAPTAPARAYLAARGAWPPDVPPPWSVRWLDGAAVRRFRLRDFPDRAAGAAAFAFNTPSDRSLVAVGLEALTPDGDLTAPRWRRTYGAQTGSAFAALPPVRRDPPAIHVVEGAIDALAVATWRGQPAWATGGTSGMRNPALAAALAATGLPIVIEADGGGEGRKAAAVLQDALLAAGAAARLKRCPDGFDPADVLSAEWQERAAHFEAEGMAQRAAETAAWEAMRSDDEKAPRLGKGAEPAPQARSDTT